MDNIDDMFRWSTQHGGKPSPHTKFLIFCSSELIVVHSRGDCMCARVSTCVSMGGPTVNAPVHLFPTSLKITRENNLLCLLVSGRLRGEFLLILGFVNMFSDFVFVFTTVVCLSNAVVYKTLSCWSEICYCTLVIFLLSWTG